ncbi:GGDEF domain-containing protein [Paraburkholderia tropica]|uniref:GGDEF domain-containing protein n=1 Tax=Paraburkholderia tropica TaxID=92647 RepID=UPI002ABD1CB4|nr:diguanylate cyclase [Paraburkholderia tropica]
MTDSATPAASDLATLIETVQRNERTLRSFQSVELQLIGARDWSTFLDGVLVRLRTVFALASVSLWVDEREPLLRELLEIDAPHEAAAACLKAGRGHGAALARLCGAQAALAHCWLGPASELDATTRDTFIDARAHKGSAIVLPLCAHDAVLGYLCLASGDPHRYEASMATDLLERFANVAALSLDNVAHREHLRLIGITDRLTGLSNRHYFDERLHHDVYRAAHHAEPISCLFIDIDHFKQINDAHGHTVGDQALAAIGVALRQHVRVGDTISRYGGEEFVALLQCDMPDALNVAERIRRAVQLIVVHSEDGACLELSVSIGVSAYRAHRAHRADSAATNRDDAASTAQTLLDAADRAMYQAKLEGRNRVSTLDMHA